MWHWAVLLSFRPVPELVAPDTQVDLCQLNRTPYRACHFHRQMARGVDHSARAREQHDMSNRQPNLHMRLIIRSADHMTSNEAQLVNYLLDQYRAHVQAIGYHLPRSLQWSSQDYPSNL